MKKIERTLIPIVSVLLVLILIAAGALRWLDRWAQDALYQRRSLPSSDLVIIGIDDRTLYTDGVPEATDAREEMFGTDRMLDALRTHEQEAPEAILAGVSGAVSAFVGAAPQFDDLTMLCLAWNGGEPSG